MKVYVTYRNPIGPVESDPTEYTLEKNVTPEMLYEMLAHPEREGIVKIQTNNTKWERKFSSRQK